MIPRTVVLEWWQNPIQLGLITLLQHFHRIYWIAEAIITDSILELNNNLQFFEVHAYCSFRNCN